MHFEICLIQQYFLHKDKFGCFRLNHERERIRIIRMLNTTLEYLEKVYHVNICYIQLLVT